jgi:hypothetical protein
VSARLKSFAAGQIVSDTRSEYTTGRIADNRAIAKRRRLGLWTYSAS